MVNITYSVFYNKNEWYKLIDHIAKYNAQLGRDEEILIKMSTFQGPHIEVSKRVKVMDKLKSAGHFSKYLSVFLKEQPSSNIKLESISDFLFEDFPNNTIHYGIHEYNLLNVYSEEFYPSVHYKITEIIILIFKEFKSETIDSITEIIIQIFVIISQASQKSINELIVVFEDLLEVQGRHYTEISLIKQKKNDWENFCQNKEDVINYLLESLIHKSNVPTDGWEKELYDLVENKSGSINKIEQAIVNIICDNINYNTISAHVIFLNGLKELKRIKDE